MASRIALTNSPPNPGSRSSYHLAASAISVRASGRISSLYFTLRSALSTVLPPQTRESISPGASQDPRDGLRATLFPYRSVDRRNPTSRRQVLQALGGFLPVPRG